MKLSQNFKLSLLVTKNRKIGFDLQRMKKIRKNALQ